MEGCQVVDMLAGGRRPPVKVPILYALDAEYTFRRLFSAMESIEKPPSPVTGWVGGTSPFLTSCRQIVPASALQQKQHMGSVSFNYNSLISWRPRLAKFIFPHLQSTTPDTTVHIMYSIKHRSGPKNWSTWFLDRVTHVIKAASPVGIIGLAAVAFKGFRLGV